MEMHLVNWNDPIDQKEKRFWSNKERTLNKGIDEARTL